MAQAVEFAETPRPDGKKPTRDQVALFIQQLKKNGKPKGRKPKDVTLRINGRAVTLAVGETDSAGSGGRGPQGHRRQARQACRRAARRLAVPVPVMMPPRRSFAVPSPA